MSLVPCRPCGAGVQVKATPSMRADTLAKLIATGTPEEMPRGWNRWPVAAEAMRIAMDGAVKEWPKLPTKQGRGIVIVGGGAVYFTNAWVCIGMLRRLGCTLPVELWHLGDGEMDNKMRALMGRFVNVAIRDAAAIEPKPRMLSGWSAKPLAMMHSAFAEVLLLDADNVPVQDPTFLFGCPAYLKHGAVAWPDTPPGGWIAKAEGFRAAGLPVPATTITTKQGAPTDYVAWETGQFVVNLQRVEQRFALSLTHWICERRDYWFPADEPIETWPIYGDKDAFYLAWERQGATVAVMPAAKLLEVLAIQQHGPDGAPLFHHKCSKWNLGVVNQHIPGFTRWAECVSILADLQFAWSGLPWDWRDMTAGELAASGKLLGKHVASDGQRFQFHDGGRVSGHSKATRWSVQHVRGVLSLILSDAMKGLHVLHADSGETWSGHGYSVSRDLALGTFQHRGTAFDVIALQSVYHGNEYRLPARFEASDVIVDVGAHIGAFTLACAQRGAGRIIAIEPHPQNYRYLVANTLDHADAGRVEIHETAAGPWGPCEAWTTLVQPPGAYHTGGWCAVLGQGFRVRQTAFADLLPAGPIRLLKFDCEASEWAILDTMPDAAAKRVAEMVGEYHLAQLGGTYSVDWLRWRLERWGFTVEIEEGSPEIGHFWARREL